LGVVIQKQDVFAFGSFDSLITAAQKMNIGFVLNNLSASNVL